MLKKTAFIAANHSTSFLSCQGNDGSDGIDGKDGAVGPKVRNVLYIAKINMYNTQTESKFAVMYFCQTLYSYLHS